MKRIYWLPILDWGRRYTAGLALQDGLGAIIVTLMLIPQSLAYAMLAGMPPVTGLYASILPLIAYALFGSSRTLAVGPVAVLSLMTAATLGPLYPFGSAEYVGAAMLLALLSGLILAGMALLRLGFIANCLSHPVISGFISASGILIAVGQFKHILGIQASGDNLLELLPPLASNLGGMHGPTVLIGVSSLVLLWLSGSRLKPWLMRLGLRPPLAANLARTAPVLVIILSILLVTLLQLEQGGLKVIGDIPQGLPPLDYPLILKLLPAALLISLVGFVESISVGQTLAANRSRQRIARARRIQSGGDVQRGIPGDGRLRPLRSQFRGRLPNAHGRRVRCSRHRHRRLVADPLPV